MFKTFVISTDSGRYNLSALVTNKGYEMPSFYDNNIDGGDETITDNIKFMIEELYPKIKEAILNKDNKSFNDWFNADVDNNILEEYCEFTIEELTEFLEMFEEAINLGFFKNQL